MFGCVLWEEAFARGRDEGVPDIGEDLGGTAFRGVENEADTKFIGGALKTESDHCYSKQEKLKLLSAK